MKPQCETASQCLRELARVMEQFNISDAANALHSKYVKRINSASHTTNDAMLAFSYPETWSFAIFELEHIPVFIGDKLYDETGTEHIAPFIKYGKLMTFNEGHRWSWTPPKSKTVQINLNREDVEYWTSGIFSSGEQRTNDSEYDKASNNFFIACKKALEE